MTDHYIPTRMVKNNKSPSSSLKMQSAGATGTLGENAK